MRFLSWPTLSLSRAAPGRLASADLGGQPRIWLVRALTVALLFGIAFVLDRATGQRHSAVFGSAAIVGSVLGLSPAVRPVALALGGYGAIWVGFNLVRAVADDAGVAIAGRHLVATVEAAAFGGVLPSAWLQETFHRPDRVQAHDVAFALVHASFFVTPFAVAGLLWWRRRHLFSRYSLATAIAFALGLAGFLLLPTAPPWLGDPDSVVRVTTRALAPGSATQGSAALAFEPNHLAALPSVHVAAAVLGGLALAAFPARWRIAGAAYAAAMSLAVIYLGEHYLLDVALGWAVALAGWRLAGTWRAHTLQTPTPTAAGPARGR